MNTWQNNKVLDASKTELGKLHAWRYTHTGDIRTATFKVGNTVIHDRGHLTALDHPAVLAIATKNPGQPSLETVPKSC